MTKKIGKLFICLGTICLLCAVGLIVYNSFEEKKSEQYASSLLETLKEKMNDESDLNGDSEMKLIEIDGYDSIGILSIPSLGLEFPVLTDWSYEKLKKAPCLYFGSYYDENFVIAAHNFQSHFGRLKELQERDLITFQDNNGNIYYYEVILIETLTKFATEEMITSGFDLTLYTCTLGGANRVTVRCNQVAIAK